ncbi:hypothetical protein EV210_1218 [Anaerospora hongkongensis]|uniref:Uncharacterized protein n=1 Tax=Anaerospora hongkongensis TaxID=244830 RepID=A0A4R1PNX7_9FIRM|nr:hypothetical protein [Anaerospora hongkongensis]TCL32443.1 hypothetical protein EV210_1218 [Anaerospora hongkongensis]
MELTTLLFYPVYLLIGFVLTLIFIPQKDYKEYLLYGIIVGALGDVIMVGLFQNLFHIMWFKNMGIFDVLRQNALSPLSWTVTVMLFLRFLPGRRTFCYIYILTFSCASVAYGIVVRNANLYDFQAWFYPIPAYLIFVMWWSFAAWIFNKTSSLIPRVRP